MTHFIKLFSSVLVILCFANNAAQAQDLIPVKSAESGELQSPIAGQYPQLRLTPDKPEIVTLDRAAANIIIGNNDHLAVTPDSSRRLILIPRLPGATFLRVLAEDGSTIMERYVVIAAPKKQDNYVRIRRACVNGAKDCQEYSMYYCPDMCHKLGIVAEDSAVEQPTQAVGGSAAGAPPLPDIGPADGVPTLR